MKNLSGRARQTSPNYAKDQSDKQIGGIIRQGVGLNRGGNDKKQGKKGFRQESGFPVFPFLVKEKEDQKEDGEKDGEEMDHIWIGSSQKVTFQPFKESAKHHCKLQKPN